MTNPETSYVGLRGESRQEGEIVASSVRQAARAKAMRAQAQKRRERQEMDRRRSALGVTASVALEERDDAIDRFELEAGRALLALVDDEGVLLSQVTDWVPGIATADVRRLQQLARDESRSPS